MEGKDAQNERKMKR